MKALGIISAVLLTGIQLVAQIPNPGFEDHSGLPSTTGEFTLCDGWGNAGSNMGSPDYYHYAGSQGGDIPETPVAIVNAFEGSAIMGMIVCGNEHTDYREYISAQLTEPLESGKRYVISFRMCNGDLTPNSQAGLAVSDVGVYLSTSPVSQSGNSPLVVSPQATLDEVFYSKEWKMVRFVIDVNQPFEYLTVGAFGNDVVRDFQVMEGTPQFAYYFFDDFYISEVNEPYEESQAYHIEGKKDNPNSVSNPPYNEQAAEADFFIPNAFTPNGDGENDVFLPVSPSHNEYEFQVFSRWGELMFSTKDVEEGWDGSFNSNAVESGVYVWRISYLESAQDIGVVEKQLHGTVNLLR
ncbi:MAG: gliding motility-associated C-terminal domain-containing protein [Flavobacteriales bacterium]|nr:gliding motility-associated C-terminal domain-containing protein [Flavobacteriales bacterium]